MNADIQVEQTNMTKQVTRTEPVQKSVKKNRLQWVSLTLLVITGGIIIAFLFESFFRNFN